MLKLPMVVDFDGDARRRLAEKPNQLPAARRRGNVPAGMVHARGNGAAGAHENDLPHPVFLTW